MALAAPKPEKLQPVTRSLQDARKGPFGYREISVRKPANIPFGALFCPVSKHLYVVKVDYHSLDYRISAAYRIGLRFGDRIHVVNGCAVSSASSLHQIYDELKAATQVFLEVDECPSTRKVAVAKEGEEFGIEFGDGDGYIWEVDPGSVGEKAGFRSGDMIVQINNYSTLGMEDERIWETMERAKKESPNEFKLVAMKANHATQLTAGIALILEDLGHKNMAVYDFVDSTLQLDAHVREENIERVYIKEGGPSLKKQNSREGRLSVSNATQDMARLSVADSGGVRPSSAGSPALAKPTAAEGLNNVSEDESEDEEESGGEEEEGEGGDSVKERKRRQKEKRRRRRRSLLAFLRF
eukprot:comp23450_c0_seq1/m.39128 comp23450_c0_seq1/g.39128  ORF comp23450_c0_seq1/g.39128 comp23450_c0_seq1/m.39128 type:complete len:354 (-) comp23450_c0_seq1:46-1107(-)